MSKTSPVTKDNLEPTAQALSGLKVETRNAPLPTEDSGLAALYEQAAAMTSKDAVVESWGDQASAPAYSGRSRLIIGDEKVLELKHNDDSEEFIKFSRKDCVTWAEICDVMATDEEDPLYQRYSPSDLTAPGVIYELLRDLADEDNRLKDELEESLKGFETAVMNARENGRQAALNEQITDSVAQLEIQKLRAALAETKAELQRAQALARNAPTGNTPTLSTNWNSITRPPQTSMEANAAAPTTQSPPVASVPWTNYVQPNNTPPPPYSNAQPPVRNGQPDDPAFARFVKEIQILKGALGIGNGGGQGRQRRGRRRRGNPPQQQPQPPRQPMPPVNPTGQYAQQLRQPPRGRQNAPPPQPAYGMVPPWGGPMPTQAAPPWMTNAPNVNWQNGKPQSKPTQWFPGVTWNQLVANLRDQKRKSLESDLLDGLNGRPPIDLRDLDPRIMEVFQRERAPFMGPDYIQPPYRSAKRSLPHNMKTPEAQARLSRALPGT